MRQRPVRRLRLAALALAALGATACDSPVCVFSSGGCTTTGAPAGALGAAASRPVQGSWVRAVAPRLDEARPSGGGVDPRSPVVLRFSESLAQPTLDGAFQLRTFDTGAGSIPIPTQTLLVGDGRLVVLVPSAPMPLGTPMEVVLRSTAEVTDLTGQALTTNPGAVVASFTTANAQVATPRVVATYPPDGAFDQSAIGEVVVVFDRSMDAATVDDASWVVLVDGVDPPTDPPPTQGAGQQIFGVPTPVPSVWRWRAVDAAGNALPLGREVEVELTLSPAGEEIADAAGGELPETQFSFRTASVLAPSAIRITSSPAAAIGIANLTPGSGNELTIEVDVDGAEDGDRLDLYLFGPNPDDPGQLLALRRPFDFEDPGPVSLAELLRDGLDLTASTSPLEPRFGDGPITIAAAFTAGPITTPVVLFDADPDAAGAQDALLDTLAPTILSLDRSTSTSTYVHDAGDVVFEGVASEALERLEVSTTLASTGSGAIAFSNGTRFASLPIDLGVLAPGQSPLEYTLVGFDRAGNASAAVDGDLFLRGFVGDAPLAPAGPGDPIEVEVFDALTLEPLTGALVLAHAVPSGGGTPVQTSSDTTGADGLATVTSHGAGDEGTIVTVALGGYDLLSVHLFGSARLSLPLRPQGGATAELRGSLTSATPAVQSSLSLGQLVYLDGRRDDGLETPFAGSVCTTSPFGGTATTCPFGPQTVAAGRSGSVAAFNGLFSVTEGTFTAPVFLASYALAFPLAPLAEGATQTVPLAVPRLLADPSVPAGQGAVDLGPLAFDASGASGLDLMDLVDEPVLPGAVRLWVEADLGGSSPPVPAGLGASFDQGGGQWNLRGALVGELSVALSAGLDPAERLKVAAVLEDGAGARTGVRRTVGDVLLLGGSLSAPPVPLVTSPAPGTDLGAGAFEVEVSNALVDGALGGADGSGLYHLRLVDAAGRGWDHYRPDTLDGTGAVVFFAPDLVAAGAAPLASGSLTAVASARAWTGFDPLGLYFTDLTTEPELFATGPAVVLSIP